MADNPDKFWKLYQDNLLETMLNPLKVNILKKGVNLFTIIDINSFEHKRMKDSPYLSFKCKWHIVGSEVQLQSPPGDVWIINSTNGIGKLGQAIEIADKKNELRITILAKKKNKKVTDYEVIEENQIPELKKKYRNKYRLKYRIK